jgi:peptidoglycan-N-acetylglucosamine deacetylase
VRSWFRFNFATEYRHRLELQPDGCSCVGSSFKSRTAPLVVLCLLAVLCLSGCRTTSSKRPEITPLSASEPQPAVVHVPAPLEIRAATPDPAVLPAVPVPAPKTPPVQTPPPQVSVVPTPTPKPFIPKKVVAVAPNYRWTHVPTDGPYIALTFDDGPNPNNTPALLDILKQRQIPATFFVLGQNAAAFPAILERMVAERHEIAIHGWDHSSFASLTPDERTSQVRKTKETIEQAVGKTPALIRPPYGATNPELNRWLSEELKTSVVLWSVDSQDWQTRDPVRIRQEILAHTKPGSIVLAHDIYRTTVAAMPATLDALLAKGYKFVTVSDLIGLQSSR